MANHGHPATPTAPVTPSPPQWQPLKWSFPFAPKSGNAADPQTWLSALAGADGGFYPLGANGMFHGGIHFDTGTGRDLKQGDGVKVIADGEVVAYRLDSSYPELTYPTTPPHYALYSTSFVLVRHKLVLPPAPDKANVSAASASTSQEYQPPADDVLEFYSLYMHQLDWAGYKAAQAEGNGQPSAPSICPLPFWQGERQFSVGTKANDHQAHAPKLNTPFRFDLDSAAANAPRLESIAAGPSMDSLAALSPRGDSKVRYSLPLSEAGNGADAPESAQGARILDRLNGTVIGLLPRGSELHVAGNASSGWAQIAGIVKGAPVASVAGGPLDARAVTGWINLDELDAVIDPQPLDTVVVLDKPFKVNAGDIVGYLGEYTNSSQAQKLPPKPTRPLLHIEVFTGASIDAFISKSRERATKLPDSGKTLLVIQQGARFVNPADSQSSTPPVGATLVLAKGDPGKGYWAKVQPTIYPSQSSAHGHGHHDQPRGAPVGNPVWVERADAGKPYSPAIRTWPIFPLQIGNAQGSATGYQLALSRAQLDQAQNASRATDDQGTQWWAVTAGDGDGKTIWGWVCEKNHPNTQWQSPWSWPGFDTVDTTSVPLLDMYRRTLYEKKQLLDGEEQEFSVVAAKVNAGMLIAKLEMAAKRQGNGKGNVVPADLKRALTVRWLAQAVSHLIFRYESEWGGDMSKWDKLSSIMGEGKSIWQTELQRIEKLQWWNQVKAVKGFPADPDVWHIHPIGLVGNFFLQSDCSCGGDCAARFKKISRVILRHEGGYVNRSDDKGGATNHGITLTTWKSYARQDLGIEPTLDSLKNMTEQQAETIYFKRYWEPKGFCDFKNERVALMIYDWSVTSGGAMLQVQKLLNQKYQSNVTTDGGLGKQTVVAINAISDQQALLQDIASIRRQYYTNLTVRDSSQIVFLKGWLNRVEDCLQVQV